MLSRLLDLIFPSVCISCQRYEPYLHDLLCLECLESLPFVRSLSDARASLVGKDAFPPEIDYFRPLFFYTKDSLVAEMIHKLKYSGKYGYGLYLGELLGTKMKTDQTWSDYEIIPVPVHAKRLKKRGYNQSEKIAQGLSISLDIPINVSILSRGEHAASQVNKSRLHRTLSMSDHFFCADEGSRGKNFILVDDVVTTGSTVQSCMMALEKMMPDKVAVVSLGVSV